MELTNYQKQLIKEIIENKIFDLNSFFEPKCTPLQHSLSVKYKDREHASYSYNFIPNDSIELMIQLKEFISLWDKLERFQLIKSIPRDTMTQKSIRLICKKDQQGRYEIDYTFIPIIFTYCEKQIFPYPELITFVSRGYLTFEEDFQLKQIDNMKHSRRISYISMIITLLIAAISIIFSFITFTTNRSVTITNPKAFQDTTHVIILQNPQSDSTSLK